MCLRNQLHRLSCYETVPRMSVSITSGGRYRVPAAFPITEAVACLQGDFAEHIATFKHCEGVKTREIRKTEVRCVCRAPATSAPVALVVDVLIDVGAETSHDSSFCCLDPIRLALVPHQFLFPSIRGGSDA